MSAAERLAALPDAPADDRLAALRARIARLVPAPAVAPSVLPSGLPGLDRALAAGGLVRGAVTTLVGPAGAGVTTVWRAMVAAGLATGVRVAVIDATRTLAPRDFAGLVPPGPGRRDRLVFVRPPDPATAPWCADLLVRSGAFPLVVLDGAPTLSRAVTGRLAQLAREADTALLVAGDESGATALGGAVRLRVRAAASASLILRVEKGGASLRPVEVSCVLVPSHRLCAHPEVPDRRGVARGATAPPPGDAGPPGGDPGAQHGAGAPGAPVAPSAPGAPVRRGRRAAEPRLARR
jgi:recombination protein RecA